jgi:hypothetical protein
MLMILAKQKQHKATMNELIINSVELMILVCFI